MSSIGVAIVQSVVYRMKVGCANFRRFSPPKKIVTVEE